MATLAFLLKHQEPVFRRLVAEAWGVPVPEEGAPEPEALAAQLARVDVTAGVRTLPPEAQEALIDLLRRGGQAPWGVFARKWGPLRPIGPARLERERPHERPASALEALWYRAMVGRRLVETEEGLDEVAYVPREWLPALLALVARQEAPPLPGRPALDEETEAPRPVSSALLDDLTTVLAGLRQGRDWEAIHPFLFHRYPRAWLMTYLETWGLVDETGQVQPEAVRTFTTLPEGEALLRAFQVWLEAPFHDVALMSGLEPLAPLPDDPRRPRQWLLEQIRRLPRETWWSLPAFIQAVGRLEPDFAREKPEHLAAWRFRDPDTDQVLTSAHDWETIDAALLYFLLTGPLHWLGLVDVARQAFRRSFWAEDLLAHHAPPLPQATARMQIRSDGVLVVPRDAPRWARYQVARAGEWLPLRGPDAYRYRWTPSSLNRARGQGMTGKQLLRLLERVSLGVPEPLRRALERWEQGQVVRVHRVSLLRLPTVEALEALRRTPAGQDVLEVLTPTLAVIRTGREARILQALWQLGYLGEVLE